MRNKMKNHVLSVKSCEWNNFSVIYFVINVSSKWNLRAKKKVNNTFEIKNMRDL